MVNDTNISCWWRCCRCRNKNVVVWKKTVKKDEKYSLRDVYNELWRGRDFEISHLWQRSVFLAVFMIAVAGGYGTYMMKVMFPENSEKNEALKVDLEIDEAKKEANKEFMNDELCKKITPLFLTYLGIVFSMLWIMMAKGSKRLYEEYELGIDKMIEDERFNHDHDVNDSYYPCHGHLPKVEDNKLSDFILSPLAGYYSPSKINITIGIVALIFWAFLNILHIIDIIQMHFCNSLCSFPISIALAIFTYSFIYFILAIYCKSSQGN